MGHRDVALESRNRKGLNPSSTLNRFFFWNILKNINLTMATISTNATPIAGPSAAAPGVQDYVVRVPKNQNKKFNIMRFHGSSVIEFSEWNHVKMERENNMVNFKGFNEDSPKFGAGSEYGKEAREEARRKKYGIISKKYKPEDQPWIIQHGKTGKTDKTDKTEKTEKKKYRGVREGGVTENASYYVFTQVTDGAFEAFPVQEWYKFQTVQSYKHLSYEEAEEEFTSRSKTFNLFNVMVRKRMKNTGDDDDGEDDDGEGKGKGKAKGKKSGAKNSLNIDEWMESSGEDSSNDEDDNDDDDDENKRKKKKGKKAVKPKKKRKNASDDEAVEESDDGDDEGREVDYISSSGDESETETKNDLKGVAEEEAFRKILNSEEEDEDEEKEEDK